MKKIAIALLALLPFTMNAQTGPGGVGDATGSEGPRNVLWLDASQLVLSNDDNVTIWPDISGNGNNLTQQAADPVPTFRNDGMDGTHNVVRFDGTERYLTIADNTSLDGYTEGITIFVVANFTTVDNTPRGIISKRIGSASEASYSLFMYSDADLYFDAFTPSNNRLQGTTALSASTDYIISTLYNGTNQYINVQSVASGSNSQTGSIANTTSDLIIGSLNDDYGSYLDADIAEIIVYGEDLTQAERIVVENYLADKYSIDISASGNDFWSNDVLYSNDLAGIGQHSDGSIANSTTSGFLNISEGDSRTNGDWLFTGHNNGDFTTYTTTESNADGYERLAREWLIEETNDLGTVTITLNESDIPSGITNPKVYLMEDLDGDFSDATAYEMLKTGSEYYIPFDLTDGTYIAFAFEEGDPSNIWYSYASGDWNDPNTWTLDGAVSALYVNPSSKVPSSQDSVVIVSGRTVEMDIDDVTTTRLELVGILDLGSTTGHVFGTLAGSGTLRLSGASGEINYPSGTDTEFYDAEEGGTLEIYGTGITISSNITVNNFTIDLDNNTDVVTMLASSLIVNGNVTINRGFFQFNDNSATNSITVEVHGNILVNANGGIDVGTANARHELDLYGDFTNMGDVDFTNRTSQTTGSEATNGIVDVNFVSSSQDQTVDLQNTTDFYRIEINKGVDDTYVVDINADDPSYFNLYGYAALGIDAAQQTTNNNALGLIYGTIKVGDNVIISPLNSTGNYSVFEGAQIWVDGGIVEKTGGSAIVPYGGIKITDGELNAPISSGITTRNNGQLTIEGGTVTINQFRTSIDGVSAQGGLVMTGGVFNITGGSTSTDYYTFSLTYTGNVFKMSGGTINLSGVSTKGGMYINSSDENISVTGGTVNFDVTNNNNLTITSRAPFFNANISRSNGSGVVQITDGSSGTGAGETTLIPENLSIINDLTIDNSGGTGTEFDANDIDINIEGSFTIENGSVVDLTGMELIFEGSESSILDIETGISLSLDTLIVNKNLTTKELTINDGAATAIIVNNLLDIQNGNLSLGSFDITVNGGINIADTVGTDSSTGVIYMNGSANQTITSSNGFIYDIQIDNANGLSLTGDVTIDALIMDNGLFDLGTSTLNVNNPISTNTTFDNTNMIITAGNETDGGLNQYFDADETILYPIGTDANAVIRYTPVSVTLDGASDDGFVSFNTVDQELQLLDQDIVGDALTYYWNSRNSDFGTARSVSHVFNFIDAAEDVPAANSPETDFIPGWVQGVTVVDDPGNTVAGSGITATTISTSTHNLVTARYTAATPAKFDHTVAVFYAVKNGEWHDPSTWSDSPNGTAFTMASELPSAGDVVQIGDNDENFAVAICDGVDDDCSGINYGAINVAQVSIIRQGSGESSILTIDETAGDHSLGIVTNREPDATTESTESSKIAISGGSLPDADFNEFNSAPNTIFAYSLVFPGVVTGSRTITKNGGGTVSTTLVSSFEMGNTISEYPNLQFESSGGNGTDAITLPDVDITINNQVRFFNSGGVYQNYIKFNDAGTTVTVVDDFRTNTDDVTIEFPATGNASTLEIQGDLDFENSTNTIFQVEDAAGTLNHRIRLQNSIVSPSNSSELELYRGAINSTIDLEFFGETNSILPDFNRTPELNNIIINKGNDTTYYVTLNGNVNLNGDNEISPQPVQLENGKLILNNGSLNIELADNSDFSIPSSAGLEITLGTVTAVDANIILDGLLKVNGGTVDFESTDIEYSNSGSALIQVSDGTLEVGGQVRRSLTSTTGVLKYRQTGGDVDIAVDGATTTSRAAFEVLNSGSEFTLTGGTFNIHRGVTGDSNESLELDPDTYDLTGSTITIFENLVSNYGSNYFNIKSTIPLNNLTIANSINLPDARVYVQPLTINDLTINSNQSVLANGLDVTITGDFVNNGTYTNNSSVTYFDISTSQTISGAGTFTLYDLTKTGAGTITSDVNLSLDNDFKVLEGIFDMGSNTIDLMNDAYIESTLSNSSGNGLVFNGTSGQNLYGKSNATVTLGTITISNDNGVDIPDGNGYNFDIAKNLRLAGGVLNIGGSLVTLKRGSTLTEVSTFGTNNMIQTNSSFTDNGLKIEFYDIASDSSVFFPIGELKYTPVDFSLDAGTTQGAIRIRPANEMHPTIIDDVETAPETEIVDTDNVLQYHWIIVAEELTNASGNATFQYDQGDIAVTAPYDTTNYIPARLLSNDVNWDKHIPTNFLGGLRQFRIPLSSFTSDEITGDYTAGVGSDDGINNNIEGAIPDQLAQYISNFGGSGNYSSDANWIPQGSSPTLSSGIGPVGAQLIISNGDDVNLDLSSIRLYSVELEGGSILRIPSETVNNRLGTVTGTGTIVVEDTELLPTGEYNDFFGCSGGAIQYSGTTDYNILSGISQIRKVILDGSGMRILPNNNIFICDTLEVNGPEISFELNNTYSIGDSEDDRLEIKSGSFSLSNSSSIDLNGDFVMSGGSITGESGSLLNITSDMELTGGTFNLNGSGVVLNGSSAQQIAGDFTGSQAFDNLTINNTSSTGVTVSSGDIEIDGILTLTDGIVNTTSTETLTINSSGNWTGASIASYINGPMTKDNLGAAANYTFPIGSNGRLGNVSLKNINTGSQDWTVNYLSANSNSEEPINTVINSTYGTLESISSINSWTIVPSGTNSAIVEFAVNTAMGILNSDDARVTIYDGPSAGEWVNLGGAFTGTIDNGTLTSEATSDFSGSIFSIGSIDDSSLPVELIKMDVQIVEESALVSWSTASELNNDYFKLERSRDGIIYEVIDHIDGNGTTNEQQDYSSVDDKPYFGISYYRLVQVDYDGVSEIFDPIRVDNDSWSKNLDITMYPNPTSFDNINIRISTGDENSPVQFQVYSITGRLIHFEEVKPSLGVNEYELNSVGTMRSGIYQVIITQGNNQVVRKLIIN